MPPMNDEQDQDPQADLEEAVLSGRVDPDDPQAIDAFLSGKPYGIQQPEPTKAEDDAPKGADDEAAGGDGEPADKPTDSDTDEAASQAATAKIDGVLTRDGKHVIPFDVLETTRTRANNLESALAESQSKLDDALAKLQSHADQQTDPGKDSAPDVSSTEDPFANLNEDDYPPEFVAALRSLKSDNDALRQEIVSVRDSATQAAQEAAQVPQRNAIQAVIDSDPVLTQLQSKGGDAWEYAKNLDVQLKSSPKWKDASMEDRFAEVGRLTADAFGMELPQARSEGQNKPSKPHTANKADPDGGPTSISDLPGGMRPPQSRDDALDEMDTQDIDAAMRRMNDDDLEALVARYS